jgi:hypothetical protein
VLTEANDKGQLQREEWNGWRDILEWVILAEGGHNTVPRIDRHGLATWITVQEGSVGFGWMSHPTEQERNEWMADPRRCIRGEWRYVVLRPGQTVFFNCGTIYFSFRLKGQQTMALAGHILQWSNIGCWIKVVADQMRNPGIVSGGMGFNELKCVRIAEELIANRVRNGRYQGMGGEIAVSKFTASAMVRSLRYIARYVR